MSKNSHRSMRSKGSARKKNNDSYSSEDSIEVQRLASNEETLNPTKTKTPSN